MSNDLRPGCTLTSQVLGRLMCSVCHSYQLGMGWGTGISSQENLTCNSRSENFKNSPFSPLSESQTEHGAVT